VIIGDVADPSDSYRAFLEKQVGGNTDIVFAGVQTGAALKALTSYARAGISLSYSEGMPLAVLELATAGIPLVLSDISAHREILGEAHVFIEVGNIERASEHLARTVRNYACKAYRIKLSVGHYRCSLLRFACCGAVRSRA
jgi:glycosyltransferase involved in cell wall biosynthesis